MNQIELLKESLEYHNNLYYNEDDPEISDVEYDNLKQSYLKLIKEADYNSVKGQTNKKFKQIKHQYPIRSLGNIHTEQEIIDAYNKMKPVIVQPKFDGLSLTIYPDKISTRGNGMIGEDVTHTAKKFIQFNQISKPVRGEAFMPISIFKKVNEERKNQGKKLYKNPRNAIAGMLRNLNSDNVIDGLEFIAYNIVNSKITETEQLTLLSQYYNVPESYYPDNEKQLIDYIENYDRTKLNYEIDGLVIKSDIPNSLEVFGETGHHPKNAIAYKFPTVGKWTKLISVTWQVGRTGKITPVAELEPIDLSGSIISRATLHNIRYINTLKLYINSLVYVVKADEIIPAIINCNNDVANIQEIIKPDYCPVCGSELHEEYPQLYCSNLKCPAKLLFRTKHMASRNALDIEGLSEATIEKMIEANFIKEPWDVFTLTLEQILSLEGYAKKSADNLYNAINKSRTVSLDRFIYACGIPLIGKSTSRDIAKVFTGWEDLSQTLMFGNIESVLNKVKDMGSKTIKSFKENFHVLYSLAKYLNIESIVIEKKGFKDLTGLIFVITGDVYTFKNRDELKKLIGDLGGKLTGSVSKKTNYLITNDSDTNTVKNKRAIELGVKIITEEDFNQLIGR